MTGGLRGEKQYVMKRRRPRPTPPPPPPPPPSSLCLLSQRSVDWPFVPHVTLADGAEPDRIAAALAALADYQVAVTVNLVSLLQEWEGRRWTPIADPGLGPPAIIGRGRVAAQ